jgi:phage-related minor tail protein
VFGCNWRLRNIIGEDAMATTSQDLAASLALETGRLRAEFTELTRISESFSRTITSAFAGAIIGGRKLSDVLRSLVASLSRQALSAALRPLGTALGGQLASLLAPLAAGRIVPFAAGGIVRSPTVFGLRGGLGLMGERGAEAILPLARGPDGRLGIQSGGGGTVNITVHISTPDVAGFERSRSQVSALLARAVQHGQRNL